MAVGTEKLDQPQTFFAVRRRLELLEQGLSLEFREKLQQSAEQQSLVRIIRELMDETMEAVHEEAQKAFEAGEKEG